MKIFENNGNIMEIIIDIASVMTEAFYIFDSSHLISIPTYGTLSVSWFMYLS